MVYKYQQGGTAQADPQEQIAALVQAAMQGDEEARQQIQQVLEAAKKGDPKAIQIAQVIQQAVNAMKSQARSQKYGGKLAYIRLLRTGAGPDEEVVYEKCGGRITKKTVKKGQPKAEQACGGMKTGRRMTYFANCGGKARKAKKCWFGGTL